MRTPQLGGEADARPAAEAGEGAVVGEVQTCIDPRSGAERFVVLVVGGERFAFETTPDETRRLREAVQRVRSAR